MDKFRKVSNLYFSFSDELRILIRALAKIRFQSSEQLDDFIEDFVEKTFEKFDEDNDEQLSLDEYKKAAFENEEIRSFFTLSITDE
mgnify:CR=1 FL=1